MSRSDKWILKDLKLHEDEFGRYYLSATYTVENDSCIKRVYFPRLRLDAMRTVAPNIAHGTMCYGPSIELDMTVDMGFGELTALDKPIETIIKEKTQELTLEEIEQKLGYKVKIVTKKGKK